MTTLLQQILDGLASGAIYATLAMALVLTFRVSKVVNFAQGELALISTYVAWQATAWGASIYLAAVAGIVSGFVLGALLERVVVRRFDTKNEFAIIIALFGVFLTLSSLAGFIWGYQPKSLPSVFPQRVWDIDGVRLSASTLGIIGTLAIEVVLLWWFFTRTKIGLAMRAGASNPLSARLVGIDVGRMLMLGWGVAACLGAVAGILAAPKLLLEPSTMFAVLIYSLAAATLGGMDSPGGAVVAGLIIGISENLAGTYIEWLGADLKIAVPLAVIFVVLIVRPNGIWGSPEVTRV